MMEIFKKVGLLRFLSTGVLNFSKELFLVTNPVKIQTLSKISFTSKLKSNQKEFLI